MGAGRRFNLTKAQRKAQNRRIRVAAIAGKTVAEIAEMETLAESTVARILDHYHNERRPELSKPWTKSFIVDQVFAVTAAMQHGLASGDPASATAILKAADRYARVTGADAPAATTVGGDPKNPLEIIGRLAWQPPTEK